MYPDESRSLENLRHMRLMALLQDMIDTEGGEKAAQALGVSYRTVSRTIESDRLTERMSAVLERHLLLGGGSAAAQQTGAGGGSGGASGRAGGGDLGKSVSKSFVEGLRERQRGVTGRVCTGKALRQLERRLERVKAGRGAQDSTARDSRCGGRRRR